MDRLAAFRGAVPPTLYDAFEVMLHDVHSATNNAVLQGLDLGMRSIVVGALLAGAIEPKVCSALIDFLKAENVFRKAEINKPGMIGGWLIRYRDARSRRTAERHIKRLMVEATHKQTAQAAPEQETH